MCEAMKYRDKSIRFLTKCMQNLRGMIAEKDAENASLKRQLAIYTKCDSPSGKDPFGYEKDKQFRKEMESSDDTKGTDDEPSGIKQPNVGGPARTCRQISQYETRMYSDIQRDNV